MTISLVRRLEPWWFTPETQEGEAAPARFLLAPLPRQVMMECYFLMRDDATAQEQTQGRERAALAALKGWENLTDADGTPVPFNREAIGELPAWLILRIGFEAVHKSALSEQEEKNSSSPSTSANGQSSSSADDATAGEARTASGATPSQDAGPSKASA